MKKHIHLFILVSVLFVYGTSRAQDIPLFSQKLTNSFIFNPALAGHTHGSITYSYKQNYSNVTGSPKNHFLSVHAPIANHRFGIGANVYQEDVTFLRSTYASVAFAYHLKFDKFNSLSAGISGEYNSIGVNGLSNINPTDDIEYRKLLNGKIKDYDFSFGLHYQSRLFKIGFAANHIATTWLSGDRAAYYYSGFAQGLLPMRGGEDLLEPYIAYRKLSATTNTLDVGLFYTYNNLITLGVSERSGKVLSGTLGVHLSKYLMIGYSREMILGNVGGYVGSANEFTVRLDFSNDSYKERFSSDYKSSIAYRRKTLSSPSVNKKSRSPKQLHRAQKKLAPYSPNRRYQNIKKLGIKTSGKKKKFTKKKGRKSPPKKRK